MKKIIAIGGNVIKTALPELKEVIEKDKIEILIHNGGSLFHDFQLAIDPVLKERNIHSYPLEDLRKDFECNREASYLVWDWIEGKNPPENSITKLCQNKNIPVLIFTALGCDYWHFFNDDWNLFAKKTYIDFWTLCSRMKAPFHYVVLGSAVIHPEVFTKAISFINNRDFIADVVDFLDMYRPRTRVSIFGNYYHMSTKEYLINMIKE